MLTTTQATPDRDLARPGLLAHPPALSPPPERVAVLLNRNARRVGARLVREITDVMGEEHVFISHTLEEAERLVRTMVHRGYGTVVCGGGDGTLVRTINLVQRCVTESNNWRTESLRRGGEAPRLIQMPRFGFLRLGTGNAIANLIGSGPPQQDLRRILTLGPGHTLALSLIDTGADRCFLAGLGYDSSVLHDYNQLKNRAQSWPCKVLAQGLPGYFLAALTRTLPRLLFKTGVQLEAHIRTIGKAYFIDPRRGDVAVEIEPSSTLFQGRASMLAVATTPFYGYGLRAFPFACLMPGMMQLRIATIGPLRAVASLPALWRGTYRNTNHLVDFLVDDITVELNRPFAFQHSGDDQGPAHQLHLRIAEQTIELIDFLSERK